MLAEFDNPIEEAGLLDTEYLDSLEEHLGQPTMSDILADGMIELADKLRLIQELATDEARSGLGRIAHDITGCAGQLGLHALCHASRIAERSVLQNREQSCMRLIAPILALGPKSIAALRARIGAKG